MLPSELFSTRKTTDQDSMHPEKCRPLLRRAWLRSSECHPVAEDDTHLHCILSVPHHTHHIEHLQADGFCQSQVLQESFPCTKHLLCKAVQSHHGQDGVFLQCGKATDPAVAL